MTVVTRGFMDAPDRNRRGDRRSRVEPLPPSSDTKPSSRSGWRIAQNYREFLGRLPVPPRTASLLRAARRKRHRDLLPIQRSVLAFVEVPYPPRVQTRITP